MYTYYTYVRTTREYITFSTRVTVTPRTTGREGLVCRRRHRCRCCRRRCRWCPRRVSSVVDGRMRLRASSAVDELVIQF